VCDRLVLVDSQIQIEREQMIAGERTSIPSFAAEHWPHARALSIEDFSESRLRFDFALCANVLSAVPSPAQRIRIVETIGSRLKARGRALFVVQYRNSHFTGWQTSANASPYRDGWLVRNVRGTSFYGLIPPEKLVSLVRAGGLEIVTTWTHGEAAYVLSGRVGHRPPRLGA
jgi:2-polyprenyl-3-methyl-5-hydroxy-6-metoxy-1,4-benzoquinol methylase